MNPVKHLEEAAAVCDLLEAHGVQATVRLVTTGFAVAVAYGFATCRRYTTFKGLELSQDNDLVKVLVNAYLSLPHKVEGLEGKLTQLISSQRQHPGSGQSGPRPAVSRPASRSRSRNGFPV